MNTRAAAPGCIRNGYDQAQYLGDGYVTWERTGTTEFSSPPAHTLTMSRRKSLYQRPKIALLPNR